MNKITATEAKKAIRTISEFCKQNDCLVRKCPIEIWCADYCAKHMPESWEVRE